MASKAKGEPELLTVPEAAALLNISKWLAWKLVQRGELPCVRLGRLVRVPRAELARSIDSQVKERQVG